jgi:hypothetical protein
MKKRIGALSVGFVVLARAVDAWALIAFPGAEGFGANSVGGRGGDVYHVTTLANDPNHVIPGSLAYGLYTKNVPGSGTVPGIGRTIVFDVGGTIDLSSGTSATLDLKDIHNVTVAGQTAPSPITIINNTVQITGNTVAKPMHDIIFQYISLRKGTGAGDDAMHVQGTADTHDIMVDHVSGAWSEDEVISVTQTSHNVTIQNSIMSEALTSGHQYGSLIRPTVNSTVSYLRNLYTNNESRNPRPGTYNGTTLDFEFQNNVIYNWSARAGYIAGADTDTQHLNMNYQGNYLIAGPSTPAPSGSASPRTTAFIKENNTSGPLDVHVYQNGNKIDSTTGTTRDGVDTGWNMFQNLNNGTVYSAFPLADQNASPFAYPDATPDTADDAYGKVISSVGAFPNARSTTDARLVNEVLNYTGVAAQTTPNASEWASIVAAPTVARAAGFDTDLDGMPNAWETQHGFNPAVADNNTLAPDGYTRLEKYLQYLTYIANWNLDADGTWSQYLNWRGPRPTGIDTTANFVSGITAARTVSVDLPVTVGQMSFSSASFGYTLAGAGPITLDVFAGTATIDDTAGSHTIAAPLQFSDNTLVTVTQAGDTLTASNLQPAAVTLTKAGLGTLAVNNVRATSLAINSGAVKILPDSSAAGVSKVTTLTLAGGSKLDLTNNKLVTASAAGSWNGSAYTGVAGLIQSGRNGGGWTGSGIVTSMTDATSGNLTSVGVATASQATGIAATATTTWAGQTVLGSDTLVMYTYGGDANLDGKINVDDYTRIDFNVALGTAGWYNGDFNYDGKINVDDYTIIDFNVGIQGAPFSTAGGVGLSVTAIPEPAGLGIVGIGLAFAGRRPKRLRR